LEVTANVVAENQKAQCNASQKQFKMKIKKQLKQLQATAIVEAKTQEAQCNEKLKLQKIGL